MDSGTLVSCILLVLIGQPLKFLSSQLFLLEWKVVVEKYKQVFVREITISTCWCTDPGWITNLYRKIFPCDLHRDYLPGSIVSFINYNYTMFKTCSLQYQWTPLSCKFMLKKIFAMDFFIHTEITLGRNLSDCSVLIARHLSHLWPWFICIWEKGTSFQT